MAYESAIYYPNIILDAAKTGTITATNSASGHPITLIYDNIPSSTWRSTGIAEVSITFDFGAATSIAGVFVGNHNMIDGDTTFKWESSADNFSSTSETADLAKYTRTVKRKNAAGTLTDYTLRNALYTAAWNRRYYRIRLQKAGGGLSYMEIGEVYIFTTAYTFSQNFNAKHTEGIESEFQEVKSKTGAVTAKRNYSRAMFDMPFSEIDQTQLDYLTAASQSDYCIFKAGHLGAAGQLYFGTFRMPPPEHARSVVGASCAGIWNPKCNFAEAL